MEIEWKHLKEVVENIMDRRGVTPLKLGGDFTNTGHRVISAKVIKNGYVDLSADAARYVNSGIYKKWMKSPLRAGDVIMTSEAPLGELAYLSHDSDWVLGQRLFAIRPRSDVLNGRFLFYALTIPKVREELIARSSGTTVMGIRQAELREVEVPVPPLPEQRRIAHVLGTLDDKIENNRKTAKTLEAMAQAIFKSWFVDFDPVRAKMAGESRESICKRLKITPEILDLFPDRLVDSELGEIPEGWEVKPIIEEFDVTMGQSPPGNTYNQIGDGLPFYQGCADFGIKYPANRVFCTEPTRTARKGYALISVRAPVGRMNVATETCAIGRGVAAIQHHTKSTAYTYNMITSLHDVFDGFNSEGTVFGAIGKSDFHKIKIISPLDIFVTKYDSICNGIDQLQTIFHEETTRLRKIRDALLPKLISGEIRAPDVDSIVGGSHNDLFSR